MDNTIYKKIGVGALTSAFLLSIVACGTDDNGDNGSNEDEVGLEDVAEGEPEPQTEEFVEQKAQAFYDAVAEVEPISEEDFEEIEIDDVDAVVELFEDNLGPIVEEYVDTSELEEGSEDMLYLYASLDEMNQVLYTAPSNWIYVAKGHTEIEEDVAYISITQGEAQVDEDYVSDNFDSFEDYVENELISNQRNDVGEMVYVDEEWKVVLYSPEEAAVEENLGMEDLDIDPDLEQEDAIQGPDEDVEEAPEEDSEEEDTTEETEEATP